MAQRQTQNELAKRFAAMHQPGKPVIMINVWDAATAAAAASHPSVQALATASFALAAVRGLADPELTMEDNLDGIRVIAPQAAKAGKPFSVDLQDGYDDIAGNIRKVIEFGVVGCNIEDLDNHTGKLRTLDDAVNRLRIAQKAAQDAGVPDFCINARTDVLAVEGGGSVEDAIERGRAFLEAGATTVYVWGGTKGRGVSRAELQRLVEGLDGKMNVKMNLRPGFLKATELAEIGVARISVGPELLHQAMEGFNSGLAGMLG